MKALLNIVIAKGRTQPTRMWKAEGFICLSSCKKERKSGRKEEVALNLAKQNCLTAAEEGVSLVYSVCVPVSHCTVWGNRVSDVYVNSVT